MFTRTLVCLVAIVLGAACRRDDPPNGAAPTTSAAPAKIEFEGAGFEVKLPDGWREDVEPNEPGAPDMHTYVNTSGRGAVTTGRYPLKKQLDVGARRKAAQGLLDTRRKTLLEMYPTLTLGEPKLSEQGEVLIGTLDGDDSNLVTRYYLRVGTDAAIGLFYWEEGAKDGKADERFRVVRESFAFKTGN
ncbi:MAG: hypothetical protein ACXWUG_15805 [Polyangiales bacterium]